MAATYPLSAATGGRYLVDAAGRPFPMCGRTAWAIVTLSVSDRNTFLDDCVARDFTAIEFGLVWHDVRTTGVPACGNGSLPFSNRLDGAAWSGSLSYGNPNTEAPDFTTANGTYWAYIDALLAACETRGLAAMVFPAYVGFNGGSQGWMVEMVANGQTKMTTYGAFVADRYKTQKNLIWMIGGDFGADDGTGNQYDGAQTAAEQGLVNGMNGVSGQQSRLFSAEWNTESIGQDHSVFGSQISFSGAYSFAGNVVAQGRRAYSASPAVPAFLLEEPFDEEGPDGNNVNPSATQPVRRFEWWGWLSTVGGYNAGNGYVWPFNTTPVDWHAHLNTQGSRDLGRLNRFIKNFEWWRLVPSGLAGMRTLVVANAGTGAATITAACSADGRFLIAYIPPTGSASPSLDLRSMAGPSRARFFDPTAETYTSVAGGAFSFANSLSSQSFTTPGNNSAGEGDWVLVLDTAPALLPWFGGGNIVFVSR